MSCFLTPSKGRHFTYPEGLKQEVLDVTGGKYELDVTFRTEDRDGVREQLFEMTENRFKVAKHLAENKPWDFMVYEIGIDRFHNAFWKYFDPAHPKYTKGNKYERLAILCRGLRLYDLMTFPVSADPFWQQMRYEYLYVYSRT